MTIEQILEAIENMKVLELNELVKAAEEKFGVSASAPVMVAGAAGGAAAGGEEKSEFDVILASAGSSKVGVIKEVRVLRKLRKLLTTLQRLLRKAYLRKKLSRSRKNWKLLVQQ